MHGHCEDSKAMRRDALGTEGLSRARSPLPSLPAWLAHAPLPPVTVTFEGLITPANFTSLLTGKAINDLTELFRTGTAYVSRRQQAGRRCA